MSAFGLSLLLPLVLSAAPGEIETIYIAPMSHNDIGFTAPPREVADSARKRVQQALELARKDKDYVYNIEVFWELDQWLDPAAQPGFPDQPASRPAAGTGAPSAALRAELLGLVRAGRMGIGAAYVNPHTSLMSAWATDQLFRLPTQWAKEQGLRLNWAVINDVPGHPDDLPHYLAAHGVRYLLLGVNQSLSKPLPQKVCNIPFWWEAPDGTRVLTWIASKGYTEAFGEYGLDPGTARFFNAKTFNQKTPVDIMRFGLDRLQTEYRRQGYAYDSVVIMHAFDNWDAGAAGRLPEAVRQWNESVGKPRLVLATPDRFFAHIEEKYGDTLPVLRGGFGGQWELVRIGAPSAMARARAREELLGQAGAAPSIEDIRRLLVYWEHSFALCTPWPNYHTRERAVEHNRQQWEMVLDWPLPSFDLPRGRSAALPTSTSEDGLEPGGLYLAGSTFIEWRDLSPLPREAILSSAVEALEQGGWRCRYRIDRHKLPNPAHVIWAWRLPETDNQAPVLVVSRDGRSRRPMEGLGGYAPFHWVAPWGFDVGSSRIVPHGPFAFARPASQRNWILSYVLSQGLSTTFKGGHDGKMTFEEVYQGENPVYEFAIDVVPASK